jgi:hypothetical protein
MTINTAKIFINKNNKYEKKKEWDRSIILSSAEIYKSIRIINLEGKKYFKNK